jgi:hypothetical protein
MRYFNLKYKTLLISLFALYLYSCKPYFIHFQESYDKNVEIEIPFYIFRNCKPCISLFNGDDQSALNKTRCCSTDLFDSVVPLFEKDFYTNGLKIKNQKIINKLELLDNVRAINGRFEYSNSSEVYNNKDIIDTIFIKEQINREVNLIPIVTYHDYVNRGPHGYNCGVTIVLTILIYDEKSLIYSATISKNHNFFITREKEYDKSLIDVENIVRVAVEWGIGPYIEKLK